MNEVRLVENSEWDKFVESSEQGTIFCTTKWMRLFDASYTVYGYFKNGNLIGGIAGFEKPMPLTPFQGILVQDMPNTKYANAISIQNEVATALLDVAPREFCNHYTFPDIRPFLWAGWQAYTRYTYVIETTDWLWENLEKQTRYEITRAQRDGIVVDTGNIAQFDDLYTQTFERKGMKRPVSTDFMLKFNQVLEPDIYIAQKNNKDMAGAVMIHDTKRAYYIFGASSEGHASSLVLWEALSRENEIDLVGCNDKNIALFKRGFGGKLMPYFGVSLNV